jgi:hypothetical protein
MYVIGPYVFGRRSERAVVEVFWCEINIETRGCSVCYLICIVSNRKTNDTFQHLSVCFSRRNCPFDRKYGLVIEPKSSSSEFHNPSVPHRPRTKAAWLSELNTN